MTNDANTLEQLSDGLAAAVERAAAWTVTVNGRRRIPASGVAWLEGGLIVTADHVLERDEEITVGLPDDGEAAAELVGRDPRSDLAVLRLEEGGPPAAERAPEGSPRVGQLVLAVGRPWAGGPQASLGVASAVGAPRRRRRRAQADGYVRSDTTFFPGFSGGPLVDVEGRVIGINSSRFRPGQGLTIPREVVTRIVEALVRQGHVRRAYLGIGSQVAQLPTALAALIDGQESGLLIVGVEEESPAGAAGLLVGDIIVGIEGDAVRDSDDLQNALTPERVGATVQLRLLRGGEPADLPVTLAERE